ncbi:threonine/serine dehydratase [Streptomyces rubradiris]|uniref:threonine ammonia-lyase n=1 Tax=Streptomyces rubradiris TaxID=285531 RepID=UPI001677177E|nr:threonine/serine dehydratase [Streptomyces rubradiris]
MTHHDVLYAAQRLRDAVVRTPLLTSSAIDHLVHRRVFLKAETHQLTGSFKFRGAYNALALGRTEREAGVVGASAGNHGQALALAARMLDTSATVLLPTDVPTAKHEAIRALGARIATYDRFSDHRDAIVHQIAHRHKLTVVPSANDPKVIAGAGTVALEMVQDLPDLAAILVPVGGGGLAAGTALIASAHNPRLRVFGVEPVGADDTHRSLRAGRITSITPPATIADSLRHTEPAKIAFAINQRFLADVITVSETDIADAMALLWQHCHLVAEPSGAVALAGLIRAARRLPEGRIGVIISGGNVDWDLYRKALDVSLERPRRATRQPAVRRSPAQAASRPASSALVGLSGSGRTSG